MSKFTLSIFDPNTLLPHRAGIAGLALALSKMPDEAPLTWQVTEDAVQLAWEGTDKEAVHWLMAQTYQVHKGYIRVPALGLDNQGQYAFTEGMTSTFLQHNQQRKLDKAIDKSFLVEEGQPEISISYKPLLSCYYTEDLKIAFSSKGALKPEIPIKGNYLPGLEECFINGIYKETPKRYLALLFLPLACSYYRHRIKRSFLVIPEVTNLKQWVGQRQRLSASTVQKLAAKQQRLVERSYRNYQSGGAAESALSFLLKERVVEDTKALRVKDCEVYQLGEQAWNKQPYVKQAVYRVSVDDQVLDLYQSAYYLFPPRVRKTDKGESWLAVSTVLPWIAGNLISHKSWYSGFFEFRKAGKIYERQGLVKMTDHLTPDEKVLFEALQGSFSIFLRGQIEQATKQKRQLDYEQVTNKFIYRLQRPSTQQDFAEALVDILSQYRSKAAKGYGAQIFGWLHREPNWKQARDLALLAIATYKGKDSSEDSAGTEQPTTLSV